MIDRRGKFKALVSIAMLPMISGLCPATRGQEFVAPEPVDVVGQLAAWTEKQFDGWVDQIVRGINDRDSADGGGLSQRLALELDRIEATCKTSAAQRKKLQIAGLGDIKRFLDEMRAMKRRYRQMKGDPNEFGKMQQRLATIQTSSGAAIFGDSSLLAKTLRMTLSAEQAAAMKQAEDESRAFARRAAVEQAVEVCDIAVGLKDEQRRKLTEFFASEERQGKRAGEPEPSQAFSMFFTRARASEAKFKAIFDTRQWRGMSVLVKQMEEGGGNGVGFRAIPGNVVVEFLDVQGFADDLVIVPAPPGVPAKADEE
jgi:hypothetical protein